MNIDLRNVSLDLEEQINRIKMQFGINTNSKAVEHATVNYLKNLKEIQDLKTQLQQERIEHNELKNNVYQFNRLLSVLKKVQSR